MDQFQQRLEGGGTLTTCTHHPDGWRERERERERERGRERICVTSTCIYMHITKKLKGSRNMTVPKKNIQTRLVRMETKVKV